MRRVARCPSVMRAWMIRGIAAGLLLAMNGCSRNGGPQVRDASQPSPSSSRDRGEMQRGLSADVRPDGMPRLNHEKIGGDEWPALGHRDGDGRRHRANPRGSSRRSCQAAYTLVSRTVATALTVSAGRRRPTGSARLAGRSPSGADSPCSRDRDRRPRSQRRHACADHEIASVSAGGRPRPNGLPTDEIVYTAADGPSPFAHPLCPNTFRDGSKIGDESPAAGY